VSQSASASPGGNTNAVVYFFGALGGMLFGYDTGVISGAILFIAKDLNTNAFLDGLIVSSLLLGAMAGAGAAGPLSDRLGRRNLITHLTHELEIAANPVTLEKLLERL